MDGFALRWEDIRQEHAVTKPVELKVIEEVPAGRAAAKTVGRGEAIRIMTGAPVPAGADTVVKVEETEPSEDRVRIFKAVDRGANTRPQGEDVKKGETIVGRLRSAVEVREEQQFRSFLMNALQTRSTA